VASSKVLWVVNYDSADDFLAQAVAVNATGVAIRTDNDIASALPKFHDKGIKVFGWRWPSANRDSAMLQADRAATLLVNGMDGYFVDPEGHVDRAHKKTFGDNWDQSGLEQLADDFCSRVKSGDPSKPFGVTSHYRAKATFPKLPWKTFFAHADVLLPQSYWRSDDGTIGHGIPADNYVQGIEFWKQAGGDVAKIVPMAGEIALATAAEIRSHVATAAAKGVDSLHFYTAEPRVKPAAWDAIASA
jgi:hypothetical protein